MSFATFTKKVLKVSHMTSVDADLRSGRRLETEHRSESIIYNMGPI
jgi:hypothetical protein